MEKFLGEFYSANELKDFEEFLKTPPLYTTLRVNNLRCLKKDAIKMLSDHFQSRNEDFIVEEISDFPDILLIKAIGPNQVNALDKGV